MRLAYCTLLLSGGAALGAAAAVSSSPHHHQHRSHELLEIRNYDDNNDLQTRDHEAWRDYVRDVLYHHNVHRRNHSAPDLQYHYQLAVTAQQIAQTCDFEHEMSYNGGNYGQNIAAGVPWYAISAVISDLWYNAEVRDFAGLYGVPDPGFSTSWGHFTQMVWRDTTHVGCFTHHCPGGVANARGTYDFTVCNYRRPGNVLGRFDQNVGRPIGYATIRGYSG